MANDLTFDVPGDAAVSFSAVTNAAWLQKIEIRDADTVLHTFEGTGEGDHPLGTWDYTAPSSGAVLTINIQHDAGTGSGWRPSDCVKDTGVRDGRNFCVVTSEDGVDDDYNDAVLTATWSPSPSRRLGPVGTASDLFDDTEAALATGLSISQIIVDHGEVVDSIQVSYGSTQLNRRGGTGGGGTSVSLDPGDVLVEVSGVWGSWFGWTAIAGLTFRTRSGRTYGPFGSQGNMSRPSAFTFTANEGEQIRAFFGSSIRHTDGTNVLASLGVTVTSP